MYICKLKHTDAKLTLKSISELINTKLISPNFSNKKNHEQMENKLNNARVSISKSRVY